MDACLAQQVFRRSHGDATFKESTSSNPREFSHLAMLDNNDREDEDMSFDHQYFVKFIFSFLYKSMIQSGIMEGLTIISTMKHS